MRLALKLGIALSVSALLLYLGINAGEILPHRTAPVSGLQKLTLKQPVDPLKPVISLEELGLQAQFIVEVSLESDGQPLAHKVEITGNQAVIHGSPVAAVLDLDHAFTLNVRTSDGTRVAVSFKTAGLPDITETASRQVVFVPAMPEKGFHWPYYLAIPSSGNRTQNDGHRRYLMIDTTNTGGRKSIDEMLSRARSEVADRRQVSIATADELGLPLLYPAFPRPDVTYVYQGESNQFYTHALDRDTATLHVKMSDPAGAEALTPAFQKAGYDVQTFLRLDLQLSAMIDHAIEYLNQYGHKVEPHKVFLSGYSGSGTFVDRYTFLQPDRVKAVASGATVDDMVLPLAEYKGERLIFPIGAGDYQEITGRSFNLAQHNQAARLIFMGEADENNTLPYGDCYGQRERQIITSLWGPDILPRAQALTKLYEQSGGKGMIILDKGIKHSMSPAMQEYMKAFIAANRDADQPVYPLPSDAEQLKFTLMK
ncbi:MAG TPA: hypothetical protein VNT01_16520 [Symbiobacteriaceae bacterium]|nr:hypothetical protein [Symbiobacteriaceae bacterium]